MPSRYNIEFRLCKQCDVYFEVKCSNTKKFCSRACVASYKLRPEITAARFWSKVDRSGECWIWISGKDLYGYGRFTVARRSFTAHRFAWELCNGHIEDSNIYVCHNCPGGDNPSCVRPSHMFLGTASMNASDASVKGRIHQGENHSNAKITEAQALEIVNAMSIPTTVLADLYSIDQSTVRDIRMGNTWKLLAHQKIKVFLEPKLVDSRL